MSPADGESEEQRLLSERTGYATTSSQADTSILGPIAHTSSGPTTPSATPVPRIAETPPMAETPGSGGSSSETSPFLPENNPNVTRDIHNSPRCSIPGGERGSILYFCTIL